MNTSRPLTHDEKRAAEAAFHGRAFNAAWSKSALAVYQGILKAKGHAVDAVDAIGADRELAGAVEGPEAGFAEAMSQAVAADVNGEGGDARASIRHMMSRQEAIDAGVLVDVTPKAEQVGFELAVALTKGLWEQSIMQSADPDPDERDLRIRDLLLAVRLRLASLDAPIPWLEVPVLFPSTTGEEPPDVFSVYALFHKDPVASGCLTLIHPKELSSIHPFSRSETDEEPSSSDLP